MEAANRKRLWALPVLAAAVLAAGLALRLASPFHDLLGAFSTSLDGRSAAQRHNIEVAARALDGATIEPGQRWSFNRAVGPRTLARGYRQAEALMEQELVHSVGGGICQLSSTLYNAGLAAGLQVVQRVPHRWTVRSVPPGRDATVWYGKTDLVLRNPWPRPVQLRLRLADARLAAEVWGTARDQEQATAWVEVLARYPAPLVRRYDPGLARGRRVIMAPGEPGYHVRTLRQFRSRGRLVRQEVVSEDKYAAQVRVIVIGVGSTSPRDQ